MLEAVFGHQKRAVFDFIALGFLLLLRQDFLCERVQQLQIFLMRKRRSLAAFFFVLPRMAHVLKESAGDVFGFVDIGGFQAF